MVVVPFPSSLPAAVLAALVDPAIDPRRQDLVRLLTHDDVAVRADALLTLMQLDPIEDGDDDDDDDGDDDGDDDARVAAARRLVPALVALAEGRDGPERYSLLTCAAQLELGRCVEDQPVDDDLVVAWQEARVLALRLAGEAVSAPVNEDGILRPLLLVIAAFNQNAELGLAIAGDIDDDFDDEDFDDGDFGDSFDDDVVTDVQARAGVTDLRGASIIEPGAGPQRLARDEELVARCGIVREAGWVYYLGLSDDDVMPVMRAVMVRGGERRSDVSPPEVVVAVRHTRQDGWLYALNRDGDVVRTRVR